MTHHPQFGDRNTHPRRAKIGADQLCDIFGKGFQEIEMFLLNTRLECVDHFAIVDRVFHAVGGAGTAGRQADLNIELNCLRQMPLPGIDTDDYI